MKICQNCGAPIARGLVYCPSCNAPVNEQKKEDPKVIKNQRDIPWYDSSVGQRMKLTTVSNEKNISKKNNNILYIVVIIFLILFLLILILI